jgi:hypothetical protein
VPEITPRHPSPFGLVRPGQDGDAVFESRFTVARESIFPGQDAFSISTMTTAAISL